MWTYTHEYIYIYIYIYILNGEDSACLCPFRVRKVKTTFWGPVSPASSGTALYRLYTYINIRGYEGSNTRGYEGSNTRGYEGSNTRAYEGISTV